MRRLLSVLLLLAGACAEPGDRHHQDGPDAAPADLCPAEVSPDGACSISPDLLCFTAGDVCGLSWGDSSYAPCRCQDGHFVCDDLYPVDGADCPYPDGTACNRGGPGGCNDWGQPSGAACSCQTGRWMCDDTCFMDCPATYRPGIVGRSCQFTATCSYPEATCVCAADGTIACAAPGS